MITFTIPGAPQGKGRPRIGKIGQHARMFTPAKTVAYEGLVAHAAHQAMAGRPVIEAACGANIFVAMEVPSSWSQKRQRMALAGEIFPKTKPDGDNVLKAIFDGMNGVVWKDDVQWCDGSFRKRYSATPGVTVEVWSLEHEAQSALPVDMPASPAPKAVEGLAF